MNYAEPVLGVQVGIVPVRTHGPGQCSGEFCSIHNPSPHHMREWPLNWRGDIGVMERFCPHGIGHPDPDDIEHRKRMNRYSAGEHFCGDGCCDAATAARNAPDENTPRVRMGGLMRCCLKTISEKGSVDPAEGDLLQCGSTRIIFTDGAWQWDRPGE